jgi:NAD(P)-dependent dehydrogenase (short-subunit alcohol dehydrogenase family)
VVWQTSSAVSAPDACGGAQPAGASASFAPGLLAGEVAVVTGGASGIGFGIASAFAELGCDVVLASRSEERLAAAASQLASASGRLCSTFVCDVRDEEALDRLREDVGRRYGPATILVNNAAANFPMPAERMTRRALGTVLEVDLVGTFNATRAFVGPMIERRRGTILNVVIAEPERGFPGFAHAGAAKAGILSLTRTWAREWGRHAIRVNAIAPGPVPTEGVASNMLGLRESELSQAFAGVAERTALGRLGTADDCAAAAVFLCSPAATWITGTSLVLDGGLHIA